jgi:hypothetical protein
VRGTQKEAKRINKLILKKNEDGRRLMRDIALASGGLTETK